jgi:hypothetical protein
MSNDHKLPSLPGVRMSKNWRKVSSPFEGLRLLA